MELIEKMCIRDRSSAFTALTEQIAEIAVYVRAVSGERKGESSDMLLTTREAAHLLNVSTRTLQRMRSEQRIAYVAVSYTHLDVYKRQTLSISLAPYSLVKPSFSRCL